MAKYSNTVCRWVLSGKGGQRCSNTPWVLPNGVRVDTPYCEQHAREWSDSRYLDLESSMGV